MSVFAISAALHAAAPLRLAIFYGIPSLVNGAAGDVARAAAAFAEYDIVVFGDGLEFADVVERRTPPGAGAAEHDRTAAIIGALARSPRRTQVYGYVDLGRSQQLAVDEIRTRIARWKAMGAAGIFFDEAGADFGVDRARQKTAVDAAHAQGLRAALNAFEPDDVFKTSPSGTGTALSPGDAYLLESFAIRNGVPADDEVSRRRIERAKTGAADAGVSLWATTTASASRFDAASFDRAWRAAADAGVDAFCWGEPSFGSADSQLPFRPRPR